MPEGPHEAPRKKWRPNRKSVRVCEALLKSCEDLCGIVRRNKGYLFVQVLNDKRFFSESYEVICSLNQPSHLAAIVVSISQIFAEISRFEPFEQKGLSPR